MRSLSSGIYIFLLAINAIAQYFYYSVIIGSIEGDWGVVAFLITWSFALFACGRLEKGIKAFVKELQIK